MRHIGLTSSGRVKFLNLDYVYMKNVIDNTLRTGKTCKDHRDCDLLDCKSMCDVNKKICDAGVANDNLQVIILHCILLPSSWIVESYKLEAKSCLFILFKFFSFSVNLRENFYWVDYVWKGNCSRTAHVRVHAGFTFSSPSSLCRK